MVNLPAARRHHRSRFVYAFGLLALLGAATLLAVVVRDPALSSSRLAVPVPAPEITVIGEGSAPGRSAGDDEAYRDEDLPDLLVDPAGGPEAEIARSDTGTLSDPQRDAAGPAKATGAHTREEISRSLFWSGIFGLAISLAGLGLVGTRRRMW